MDVSTTFTLGCVSLILILWFIRRKRRMTLFERLGIPGPKPNLITGNLTHHSENVDIGLDWDKKYGKIFGVYFGAWPFLVVSDLELLKHVQIKDFKTFTNRAQFLPRLGIPHPLSNETIFGQTDEKWKNARNAVTPAFTAVKLKKMMPTVTSAIEVFLNKISATGQKTFDIAPMMRRISFDVISKTTFGINTDIQKDVENQFLRSVLRVFDAGTNDFLSSAIVCFPELGQLPQKLRIIKDGIRHKLKLPSTSTVMEICRQIIRTRRENDKSARSDLLQSMIDASELSLNSKEEDREKKGALSHIPLTDNEVVANAFGFMLGGFDAMSSIMSFCMHYLVENPEIQSKLQEEIKEKVKGKVDYDNLGKLEYLNQILSETLRMFPFNFIGVHRTAADDYKYQDITIPKGVNVSVNISALNMNPDYWTEPEVFKPERFSPENEGNVNPLVYQPFGGGPRSCIGYRFAQMLMKSILASLFQSYRIEKPADAKPFDLEYTLFSVRPKYGVEVRAFPI